MARKATEHKKSVQMINTLYSISGYQHYEITKL
jgi:hypothetical protein